jgi:7,8-dihydropterin-6-yl-methyl-4-(beta-D-ribofuranosyl)aminobenzene 5'-phosphate synthase
MLAGMKLSVLMDNSTIIDRYFLAEPAVSYFIEDGDTSILFDTGYSDAFMYNASKLGIDVMKADYLVLSHGHIDHTGGLDPYLKRCMERRFEDPAASCPELIAHPAAFYPKVLDDAFSVGIFVTKEACSPFMKIRETGEPLWLTDRLVFLGEIPRRVDFERPGPIGVRREAGGDVPDDLPDDTAMAYVHSEGLVVITGCSHAGICNIVEQARKVTGIEKVHDIIGGFHLLNPPEAQLEGTARYLESLDLPILSACHCTDFQSRIRLAKAAPIREIGSGLQIEY